MSERPLLETGELGTFDDSGVLLYSLVADAGRKNLYYGGWSLGATAPYHFHTGLAVSDDGGKTYLRRSRGPLFGRDAHDPYMNGSPCILREGALWRMWYVAGTGWETHGGAPTPRLRVQYAESSDGVNWRREGPVCVEPGQGEIAVVRPCVLREGKGYRMFYSYRSDRYRIGYAESADGLRWTRKDAAAGIDVSPKGWDSESVEYAFVFAHRDREYMLYNGNGYGKTGIGLALHEEARA